VGHPHPTVDVPGVWPSVAAEIGHLAPGDHLADELLTGLTGGRATSGHVCATAFVVTPDRCRLLLVDHPRLGWSNPGGHLETHETSLDAARRELAEESGLVGLPLVTERAVAVHVTDVEGDRPHRHWNIAWAFHAASDAHLIPEDGNALEWFDVDDLPDGARDLRATWQLVAQRLGQ
jgi:ADP-ribose pyrophosphatase YjhB (NUDIX family)